MSRREVGYDYGVLPELIRIIQKRASKIKDTNCQNLTGIRQNFKTEDNVGTGHYVFNIKSNEFRI